MNAPEEPSPHEVDSVPENPYLLLTPGPLSTSKAVRAVMRRDWCTWDDDYNGIVQWIRGALLQAANLTDASHSVVLMQGSGTFSVESTIGSAVPRDGKLLVLANGAYGQRIASIARVAGIDHCVEDFGELEPIDVRRVTDSLTGDAGITHVAAVHCETTTGMRNPIEDIAQAVKKAGRSMIVDAMSSFGGVSIDIRDMDFLVSSANKCIQGVPGFGFVIASRYAMKSCQGNARSLSLDLFDQWQAMESGNGKWRYTSPTHTVRAFAQALLEFEKEGGATAREARYKENHQILVKGMRSLGFQTLLPDENQSWIITSFVNPTAPGYDFKRFYDKLKQRGFVIYPGKVTSADTFRVGNIGHVFPEDMRALIEAMRDSMDW